LAALQPITHPNSTNKNQRKPISLIQPHSHSHQQPNSILSLAFPATAKKEGVGGAVEEREWIVLGASLLFGLVACGLQPPLTHPKTILLPSSLSLRAPCFALQKQSKSSMNFTFFMFFLSSAYAWAAQGRNK